MIFFSKRYFFHLLGDKLITLTILQIPFDLISCQHYFFPKKGWYQCAPRGWEITTFLAKFFHIRTNIVYWNIDVFKHWRKLTVFMLQVLWDWYITLCHTKNTICQDLFQKFGFRILSSSRQVLITLVLKKKDWAKKCIFQVIETAIEKNLPASSHILSLFPDNNRNDECTHF